MQHGGPDLSHLRCVVAAWHEYADEASSHGYTVTAGWKARAAKQVGYSRNRLSEKLTEVEAWWGRPLWDVYDQEGGKALYTLGESGLLVIDDFQRILEKLEHCQRIARAYTRYGAGWGPAEPLEADPRHIVMLRDFVFLWNMMDRRMTATKLGKAVGMRCNKLLKRTAIAEAVIGAKLMNTRGRGGRPRKTEVGVAVSKPLGELVERWQRLVMFRSRMRGADSSH